MSDAVQRAMEKLRGAEVVPEALPTHLRGPYDISDKIIALMEAVDRWGNPEVQKYPAYQANLALARAILGESDG